MQLTPRNQARMKAVWLRRLSNALAFKTTDPRPALKSRMVPEQTRPAADSLQPSSANLSGDDLRSSAESGSNLFSLSLITAPLVSFQYVSLEAAASTGGERNSALLLGQKV